MVMASRDEVAQNSEVNSVFFLIDYSFLIFC